MKDDELVRSIYAYFHRHDLPIPTLGNTREDTLVILISGLIKRIEALEKKIGDTTNQNHICGNP